MENIGGTEDWQVQTFLVGGAVRDHLMGRESNDKDYVVVGATPEDMLAQGFEQVGREFPVFIHPESGEEYALARTERSTGPGYHGFACDFSPEVTLEEDLARRDLTINAMAMDESGVIIDPYGGQDDLRNRNLHHVSNAFSEDPLRILRVARFTAQYPGFDVDPSTMNLMQNMVNNGDIDHLTPERVWKEMEKALKSPKPAAFIETMRQCGGLKKILPEVDNLQGVPQVEKYHPEGCVYTHNQMVLERASEISDDSVVRFAAMMHDVGKGITPEDILPRHIGHEVAGVPLVQDVCRRLRVPNEYRECALNVTEYHLHHHKVLGMKPGKVVGLIQTVGGYHNNCGEERLERFLLACQADAQGRGGADLDRCPQGELLREVYGATKDIGGRQFIDQGHEPGPKIGTLVSQERVRKAAPVVKSFRQQLGTLKEQEEPSLER